MPRENIRSALEEYQSIDCLSLQSKYFYSRRLVGRLRQGLSLPVREPFNPKTASPEDCEFLPSKNVNVPLVDDVPPIFDSIFRFT